MYRLCRKGDSGLLPPFTKGGDYNLADGDGWTVSRAVGHSGQVYASSLITVIPLFVSPCQLRAVNASVQDAVPLLLGNAHGVPFSLQ